MAKRSYSVSTYTPTATADTTNLQNNTTGGYIQGGSATQRNIISEIFMGGQAGASAPTIMVWAANSTAGSSLVVGTSGRDAPLDGTTAALAAPAAVGRSATIVPQRAATLHILNLSFNAFGGIVRWLAAPGEELGMVGLSANVGSYSLSAFTGGTPGLMGSMFIYETL